MTKMVLPLISLVSFLVTGIVKLLLLQFDMDATAKFFGNLGVFMGVVGGLVCFVYYMWHQRSRAALIEDNKQLKDSNDALRAERGDYILKISDRDKTIVELKDGKRSLREKWKLERKIRLLVTAKLEGHELPFDHYDELDITEG